MQSKSYGKSWVSYLNIVSMSLPASPESEEKNCNKDLFFEQRVLSCSNENHCVRIIKKSSLMI